MARKQPNDQDQPPTPPVDPTTPAADATLGSPKGGASRPAPNETGPGRYGGDPAGVSTTGASHQGSGTGSSPDQPPATATHGGSSPGLAEGGDISSLEEGDIGGITDASDASSAAQARDAAHQWGGTWGVGGGGSEVH